MDSAADLLNSRLGQYELRELAVESGIIIIYKAYQPALNRWVAVQTLHPQMRDDPKHQRALKHGAEMIAWLEHPNILPIIDYDEGRDTGIPYIVMRWMQGGTLRQRLKNGALPIQDAISTVRQISGALEYVHSLGMVHGDPATGNIVFDTWGGAYLADFILYGFVQVTKDEVAGTLPYMAPERLQGDAPTFLTDQYALAAIAYEMLSGRTPFDMGDLRYKFEDNLREFLPLPQASRPEIPQAVNDVLYRALAKAPEDRYPTVSDFAREFERALNSTPQHLFISYSRRDRDYADELKGYLRANGLPVWIDEQIEHGDQWFNEIHEAIKSCAAFLVVMSPSAEASEWVQKEVLLAKRYKKPIFPLLLSGEEFALLIDIQFADVRQGQMPGADFHRRLSRVLFGTT
ncbi:MAG: TIR domain-containing protein [bacterium]|nr:TIR domain-containing protein [bacterium]